MAARRSRSKKSKPVADLARRRLSCRRYTIREADDGGTLTELQVQPWLQKWQLTLDTSKPATVGAQPVGYGKYSFSTRQASV
ncbi:hypothetical protein Mycsm_07022 (plasmid) [Mycobacterium sp. JS623]|nr:hypothetical protein Mycsm_07022 [Mycobacterium sp. JS623]